MLHLIWKLFITILLLSLFCLSNPLNVMAATQLQNITPTQLEELNNLFPDEIEK